MDFARAIVGGRSHMRENARFGARQDFQSATSNTTRRQSKLNAISARLSVSLGRGAAGSRMIIVVGSGVGGSLFGAGPLPTSVALVGPVGTRSR